MFIQKEGCGLSEASILETNRRELAYYKQILERICTRYQIVSEQEREGGSIIVPVRKQYKDKADVAEYFQLSPIDAEIRNWKPNSGSFLVKENHQLCWWFQKALAMPRNNYPSEARNHYKNR